MRRKLFIFLALFFIGLVFPLRSFAQEDDVPTDSAEDLRNRFGVTFTQQQIDDYIQATEDCSTPSLECLVKNTITFTMIELTHNIIGDQCALTTDPDAIESCTQSPLPGEDVTQVPRNRGFIGDAYNFMGTMVGQPPANTATYVSDLMNSAHIATPAYAQGLGFAALDPILELWKKFRNIAYMGFIFIFIVIGFMIMFRAKIGGQTAVTAQQAIPNVIISLIFVTFSYAIAGLLIDFMYLVMFMMVGLFQDSTNANIINYSIWELGVDLFKGGLGELGRNINIVSQFLKSAGTGGELINNLGGGAIGGLTLTVIIAIALLISTFKLFFELLKSYASIVLSVVISPLVLMAGALPGKNVFKPWFMSLVGNLAAFPTVLLMVIVFKEFTKPLTATTTGGFVPPFLLNLGVSGIIGPIMGFAVALALPEIVSKVKKMLGATEGFGFEIAKAATGRMKDAWDGKGVPLGFGAKRALQAPLNITAGAAAGGYGTYKAMKGQRGRMPAAILGGIGGGLVGGVSGAPVKIVGGVANAVKQRGGELIARQALRPVQNRLDQYETNKARKTETTIQGAAAPPPTNAEEDRTTDNYADDLLK